MFGSMLTVMAGPPFLTDDPEPVEYQHWEVYLGMQHTKLSGDWSGTAPFVEVNYGVLLDLQLHLIAPLAYDAPENGATHMGYGDTELGVKWRFLRESEDVPQVGIYPLLELPTGKESLGLGNGHPQLFLPLWLQKSFGDWTIYGGGGYGINSGADNENWGFGGLVVQRKITDKLTLGAEIYRHSAQQNGGQGDTAFNLGSIFDITEHQHLLFSLGRSINGPTDFQTYLAFQWTFGP